MEIDIRNQMENEPIDIIRFGEKPSYIIINNDNLLILFKDKSLVDRYHIVLKSDISNLIKALKKAQELWCE